MPGVHLALLCLSCTYTVGRTGGLGTRNEPHFARLTDTQQVQLRELLRALDWGAD